MELTLPGDKLGVILRVGLFIFIAFVGLYIFSILLSPAGYLVQAAIGTFAAAAVANTIAIRVFERAGLADIGMHWNAASARNLALGIAGGLGAALLVLGPPLLMGIAEMRPDPQRGGNWANLLFVTI